MKPEPDPPPATVQRLSISDAARALGCSERTIYRRLKSGHLKSCVSVSHLSDKRSVLVEFEIQNGEAASENVRHLSETEMVGAMNELRAELRRKDEQIQYLLENERALAHTIQKMQEQLHELSRYVLTPPLSDVGQTSTGANNSRKGSPRLARLFPGFRRKQADKPK